MRLELPDPATGDLNFPSTPSRVRPGMTRPDFLNMPEGQRAQPFITNAPHRSYKLDGPYEVDGVQLGLLLYFTNDLLRSVTLYVASGGTSWSEWSGEQENRNGTALEQLALSTYGTKRDFPWGKILVSIDPRSGSAGLHVSYA